MKLLVIFPSTQRGGAEEYSLKIASAAFDETWEVHTAFPETDGTASLIKDFTEKEITYHPLEIAEVAIPSWEEILEKNQGILSRLTSIIVPRLQFYSRKIPHFCRTLLLLLKIKPDAVMINLPWPDYGMGSVLACGLLKIPTLVVFQLIPAPISLSNIKQKLYTWARKRKQQWLGVSLNNCQFICESFKIPVEELHCIYNGAKQLTYNKPENITEFRTQVRQELGLSATSKIALTVARLSYQKGHDYLIPTIPHLSQEFPELKFVWVGDGEKREFLVNLVKEYGVSDKVLFLGHRSDVPRLLQAADLFVFPTHYEGQPFAILEAMCYSLPVIASATNGIPEVMENHVHGLLTRTGDSCDLLEAIRWALRNPDAMEAMAKKAQGRVQDFSEEKMIQETLNILKEK